VVLDNAASTAQVLPLLPTSGAALVLITSRRRLAGLDGVHPESLPVLDDAEAVALLEKIVGARAAAEPEAAVEVVRRCGRLPLAIRLAGARLAHRPRWRVADLLRRLSESALPELAAEDRTVASAFALSYEQLPDRAQRMFRLLGLHPGERFEALAVAALTDEPLDRARDLLDDLLDVHLVEEPEPVALRSDEVLLARVLRNLLTNALKFTEQGSVRLTARRLPGGDRIELQVTDTGIGIPEELHERIFDEFYQVPGGLAARGTGTGLGLPYARRLVAILGGELRVQSEPGRGSAFTVCLPIEGGDGP
jgi:signal transduction histidine kinase